MQEHRLQKINDNPAEINRDLVIDNVKFSLSALRGSFLPRSGFPN